jgi:hypothetical protein
MKPPRANARMSLESGSRLLKRAPHNAVHKTGSIRFAKKRVRDSFQVAHVVRTRMAVNV